MKTAPVIVLAGYCLLSACSTGRYSMQHDSAPEHDFDASHIPDAVPRVEPPSRQGNPDSYVVHGKRYYVKKSSHGFIQRGIASWYGKKFHGHRTSNGEIYDMYHMTAAHKTLPLPTYAEVTNLGNGKRVIVRINDRGPFHANRVIDLSYAAAKKLGVAANGTAKVEIRAIDPRRPADITVTKSSSRYIAVRMGKLPAKPNRTEEAAGNSESKKDTAAVFIQVGAFSNRDNAEKLCARLNRQFASFNIATGFHDESRLYRVRIGPFADRKQADQLVESIIRSGLGWPRVVTD